MRGLEASPWLGSHHVHLREAKSILIHMLLSVPIHEPVQRIAPTQKPADGTLPALVLGPSFGKFQPTLLCLLHMFDLILLQKLL